MDKTARVEPCAVVAPEEACDGGSHAEIMQESSTFASDVEQEARHQASGGIRLIIGLDSMNHRKRKESSKQDEEMRPRQ